MTPYPNVYPNIESSNELMLLLLQTLTQSGSLHFGMWEADEEVNFHNLIKAQQRYSEFLVEKIDSLLANQADAKILDVGCGVGVNIELLVQKGYHTDGIVPSAIMAEQASRISPYHVYNTSFEAFSHSASQQVYDLVFFSESYQYINIHKAFEILETLLSPSGHAVIFDFFGLSQLNSRRPFGGHPLERFNAAVKNGSMTLVEDIDLTPQFHQNALLLEKLCQRFLHANHLIDRYFANKKPYLRHAFKFLFRKKLHKMQQDCQKMTANYFLKHKTYRLIVLRKKTT